MGSVVFGRKRPNGRRIKGKVKKATKVLNKNLQTNNNNSDDDDDDDDDDYDDDVHNSSNTHSL
ncbi:hypothetical protein ACO22_02007 [Paracoccidioides brasiliensis]|uniref:Uncharacterized protein n=1 Tax=Paracoccidioides brasiliensis TaxID=121759 RepID=A0A1D2JJX9_PARBR|nr:hypothetical protein ACO22_02007 [Paracoccidioides brasiliensis]